MNRLTLTFGGRTVHWNITSEVATYILQSLVQMWGPAKEEGDET